nr:AMP-binding protein [Pseudodesulfovibrio sp.]
MPVSLTRDGIKRVLSSLLEAHVGTSMGANSMPVAGRLPESFVPVAANFFSLCADDLNLEELCLESLADVLDNGLGGWPDSLVFQTSGSTGEPMSAVQEYRLLSQEIMAQVRLYEGRNRVVCLVPQHHIYGFLFGVMLPHALGIPVRAVPPLPTQVFYHQLRPGDLVVGFPMFWTGLMQTGGCFPANVHCVTSTGPCPADTIAGLIEYGASRFYEIFGSSETGGLGWRVSPEHPYELFDYWHPGEKGVVIRSKPDGKRQVCILPNEFDWESDKRFYPGARKDKAVQVGGVNVYPDKVASLIVGHEWVEKCAVRQDMGHIGGRLKVFLVPTPDAPERQELVSTLRAFLSSRLTPSETPRKYTLGSALPVNAMGKLADWE